jgi:RNA polymerase sigma-70 factor (ECF subfamily)
MIDHATRQAEVVRLLTRHHTTLYAYIYTCVRSHHDAEDILQNVSVAVMEAMDHLTDVSGFLPWAREIARRCVLAYWRKYHRERPLDPELLTQLAEAADELERERPTALHSEALMACLEKLPPQSKRLIVMRYDGESGDCTGLARQLGRSVQSIYAQIKRIKIALRNCVERRLALEYRK